jgi:predicted GTPase
VDTAGWMERSGKEKGPASLSVVQSRKNLMRAHIVALVLDAERVFTLILLCNAMTCIVQLQYTSCYVIKPKNFQFCLSH